MRKPTGRLLERICAICTNLVRNWVPLCANLVACAGPHEPPSAAIPDAAPPPTDDTCAGPCPISNVKHVVILVQENHTFDNHFGAYCKAQPGSSPTCTDGPECCEAAPPTDPSGHAPVVLTDDEMG